MPPAPNDVAHRIAMLGPPSSGKTTFLAALSIALMAHGTDLNLTGATAASEQLLIDWTTALTRDRVFPEPTRGIEEFKWELRGEHHHTIPGKWGKKLPRIDPVAIGLDLTDGEGEIWKPERAGTSERTEIIAKFARSGGIAYIFDPIREIEEGDAFDYTYGPLVQIAGWARKNGGLTGAKLPHHVAVCITKFDDPRVFDSAEKLDLVTVDPDDPFEFPRVHPDDGLELFRALCDESASGNGERLPNLLGQFFHASRIRYFVTSAIGFYTDPRNRHFDPADPLNILEKTETKQATIRGTPRPINVVEPLLWLNEMMSGPLQPVPRAASNASRWP